MWPDSHLPQLKVAQSNVLFLPKQVGLKFVSYKKTIKSLPKWKTFTKSGHTEMPPSAFNWKIKVCSFYFQIIFAGITALAFLCPFNKRNNLFIFHFFPSNEYLRSQLQNVYSFTPMTPLKVSLEKMHITLSRIICSIFNFFIAMNAFAPNSDDVT